MDFADSGSWLVAPLQILLVDLLLGADNALVIALASRSAPPEDRRAAVAIGVAGAIAFRLALTMIAASLLALPFLKIAGAVVLVAIALNLSDDLAKDDDQQAAPRAGRSAGLWAAAAAIVVADAAMSLDNVVALAAIAKGQFWLLALGVALSLPALGYGGLLLAEALERAPGLATFGAALLGWVAGGMAIGDPLVASWAEAQAPALVALAPALTAAFVLIRGRPPGRARVPIRPAPLAAAPAPRPEQAPPPPARAPLADDAPEPDDRAEPPRAARRREDRVAVIGVLLLAVAAGAILMIASYADSWN